MFPVSKHQVNSSKPKLDPSNSPRFYSGFPTPHSNQSSATPYHTNPFTSHIPPRRFPCRIQTVKPDRPSEFASAARRAKHLSRPNPLNRFSLLTACFLTFLIAYFGVSRLKRNLLDFRVVTTFSSPTEDLPRGRKSSCHVVNALADLGTQTVKLTPHLPTRLVRVIKAC
ncbi:unnamed protein product [Protopolystoma xenopodis]|uniref:Uncharacterized protein n=1 Tax=Protopolystoma xenopodis TaxID=117903 RepID=A0A448XR29_9PLAT|nr:unnamed protein product [Protopolystoma xenopodis]